MNVQMPRDAVRLAFVLNFNVLDLEENCRNGSKNMAMSPKLRDKIKSFLASEPYKTAPEDPPSQLSCFFCRLNSRFSSTRKIACGPNPNSKDRTCNQCSRTFAKVFSSPVKSLINTFLFPMPAIRNKSGGPSEVLIIRLLPRV
ncbi:hypothetical protein BT96DRAFT_407488 [Gymnopus androsaceus JB14]|uniref:Uncharacterized protein n=1 Tax=Gymnopus androsaceus JB14 TaxID=1447944 RepID=A0A6A4GUV4_9AGAR|nr:hypothetical protein BT96DRAFT_407488 [Gymnopus androsaceus JB14]